MYMVLYKIKWLNWLQGSHHVCEVFEWITMDSVAYDKYIIPKNMYTQYGTICTQYGTQYGTICYWEYLYSKIIMDI